MADGARERSKVGDEEHPRDRSGGKGPRPPTQAGFAADEEARVEATEADLPGKATRGDRHAERYVDEARRRK